MMPEQLWKAVQEFVWKAPEGLGRVHVLPLSLQCTRGTDNPPPIPSCVHRNRMKSLLCSSNLDLDHEITDHKLPKNCERGSIQIDLSFLAKVLRIKVLTKQDRH